MSDYEEDFEEYDDDPFEVKILLEGLHSSWF
jgi:hypothetical protein